MIVGIDEAGRGPVIGPLVIVGVAVKEENLKKLEYVGVKDSKLLTPLQRERLFDSILEIVSDYKIIIIQPNEIDDAVNGKGGLNLNWLEAHKSAEIINALKPEEVILDCPSTNISAFTNYIKNLLKVETKIIAEHKADLNYPVVSAASIIAKVTRDAEIQKLKMSLKEDIGSGYPADPMTQRFLEKFWDKHPEVFRHSWASYKKYSGGSKKQKKLGDF